MEQVLFKDLDLSKEVLNAIEDLKFEYATEIQSKAIPLMKSGTDIMGLSQTGSGKTLAFAIPIIESIRDSKKIEALVLCPTRELALQIEEVFFIDHHAAGPLRHGDTVGGGEHSVQYGNGVRAGQTDDADGGGHKGGGDGGNGVRHVKSPQRERFSLLYHGGGLFSMVPPGCGKAENVV